MPKEITSSWSEQIAIEKKYWLGDDFGRIKSFNNSLNKKDKNCKIDLELIAEPFLVLRRLI